jgi:hypothetical protein
MIHRIYAEAMLLMEWFYAVNQTLDMPLLFGLMMPP